MNKLREERTMKTTLLIMAAGIGSRFGTGIKQLEPVVNLVIPWMELCTRMSKLSFMILEMWNRKQKRNAGAEEKNLKLKQNKKRTKNNIWRFGSGSHLWFKGNFELQVGAFLLWKRLSSWQTRWIFAGLLTNVFLTKNMMEMEKCIACSKIKNLSLF